jgi:hypothetical protein
MEENIKVTCPECQCVLVIRRRDGEILEVRHPILEESTGDRFQDAFMKVKGRSHEIDSKVADAKKKEAEKLKSADDFFKQALERAKTTKDEKPINPMDIV